MPPQINSVMKRRTGLGPKRAIAAAAVGLSLALAGTAHADGALNGRIAFTSFRDAEQGDLWTVNPDGSAPRKLTGDAPGDTNLYDAQADWSPDGGRLAFRRGPDASNFLEVWKMDLYGENLALLAKGSPSVRQQIATQPSWAPNGDGLLFRSALNYPNPTDTDVWRMNSDGAAKQLVARIDGQQLYPSYSPDMTRVTYVQDPPGNERGIYSVDLSATTDPQKPVITKLFDAPGTYDSAPSWSPDGRQIAFESDQDGDMDIYVMNADGTNVRQITDDPVHEEGPVWSPDGEQMVFTREPVNLEGDVWTMNADGTNRRQVTDSPGRDESPDWQPVPHAGDLVACGDATAEGSGAYSVKRSGKGLPCEKAKDVASRWSAAARDGSPDDTIEGFVCDASDAGYDASKVDCTHRGNRGSSSGERGRGNDKALVFLAR